MKHGSTIVLRGFITIIEIMVVGICLFILPRLIESEIMGDFDYGYIFLGMYVTAIPFFVALHQAWRLLNYIDKNQAFSAMSVKALAKIKYSAFTITALYVAGMPYIFYLADKDDAPGMAAIGLIVIGASFVIATAAAVFEGLFKNAVAIKSENDLTV